MFTLYAERSGRDPRKMATDVYPDQAGADLVDKIDREGRWPEGFDAYLRSPGVPGSPTFFLDGDEWEEIEGYREDLDPTMTPRIGG